MKIILGTTWHLFHLKCIRQIEITNARRKMISFDIGEENIFSLHTHSKLFLINILFVNNVVYFKTKRGYKCVFYIFM